MKIFRNLCAICFIGATLHASSYIYLEEGFTLPLKDKITLYKGAPVQKITENSNSATVILNGYVDNEDAKKIYATQNLKLLLAEVENLSALKISGNKAVLEVEVSNDFLTDSAEEAWETNADRFYTKCTQCHAAKVVEDHTMLEWEGLFASMKEFAKPTTEDTQYILRFLRAYAKDGIIKEEN